MSADAQLTRNEKDANYLVQNSKVVAGLLAAEIISRRLYLLFREAMTAELLNNWDLVDPDTVLKILTQSAEKRAVSLQLKPQELREEVLQTLLPIVDAICCAQGENDERPTTTGPVTMPRGEDSGTPELGAVLCAPGSNQVE